MVDIPKLENDARQHASKAVELDRVGNIEEAIFYYVEAAQSLISVREIQQQSNSQIKSSLPNLNKLIEDYIKRAEQLKADVRQNPIKSLHLKDKSEKNVERARYLLTQGLDKDESGEIDVAFKLCKDDLICEFDCC
ncbi:unnamed protein product [Didymodactylos carnosus]|uniref:MIT domain-containing protein n=1 Tax=Didymodactylos carnosus TaxID=1234261 RepID=A0A8S2FVL1_9BILA|nr:unnamed protein product [Didymodactylos carnosus]CAF4352549.1 unnamed protein product [Didymodactylos carnosus]